MTRVLKFAALFVAIACLTWILVIARWRSVGRVVDAGDLVLWLVVLPVLLFALVLAGRWAVRGALARQAARDAAAVAATTPAAASPARTAAASADVAASPWLLLHAGLQTAAGSDAQGLLAAIEAGAPRPKPDARLRDRDGLPVVSARIESLETAPIDDALAAAAEAGSGDVGDAADASVAVALAFERRAAERVVRALSALDPLLEDAVPRLARVPGTVRVLAAWPADWDDAACQRAQRWLEARLPRPTASPSMAKAPATRWMLQAQRRTGAELLEAATRLLDPLQREGRADPVVLLACHSDLDDTALRQLDAARRLFHSSRQPRVPMPGEGAALLVLAATAATSGAAPAHDGEPVVPPPLARLHRPAVARRVADIDAPGRVTADDALALVRQVLAHANATPESVAALASDADQHTARATELFAVTLDLLPALDAGDDLRLAGTLCGRLGPAAPLVAIALAAARAAEARRPALSLSLADEHWRAASLLLPPT